MVIQGAVPNPTMPGLAQKIVKTCSRPKSMDGDNTVIEVKVVKDRYGQLKDEIMIVVPLAVEVDEDPLYYYPPKKVKKLYSSKSEDDEDTCSESDSDDEQDTFDENPQALTSMVSPLSSKNISTLDPSLDSSFLEELMQTLDNIFGCSYGQCAQSMAPPVLKSSLRRKGESAPINRTVSFTKLEIREFNMTLGNHPSAVTVRTRSLICSWLLPTPLHKQQLTFPSFHVPHPCLVLSGTSGHAGLGCPAHTRSRNRSGLV